MQIATGGGEDSTVLFHSGPPFQRVVGDRMVSEKCHERGAINCPRYNKDETIESWYDGKSMGLNVKSRLNVEPMVNVWFL